MNSIEARRDRPHSPKPKQADGGEGILRVAPDSVKATPSPKAALALLALLLSCRRNPQSGEKADHLADVDLLPTASTENIFPELDAGNTSMVSSVTSVPSSPPRLSDGPEDAAAPSQDGGTSSGDARQDGGTSRTARGIGRARAELLSIRSDGLYTDTEVRRGLGPMLGKLDDCFARLANQFAPPHAADYILFVRDDGQVSQSRAGGADRFPELDRCVAPLLRGLNLGKGSRTGGGRVVLAFRPGGKVVDWQKPRWGSPPGL